MMADTMLDLCVEAGGLVLEFSRRQSFHSGTGYENVCVFADMDCPGAKNNKMFESRCIDAKKYGVAEMYSCACSYANEIGERLK